MRFWVWVRIVRRAFWFAVGASFVAWRLLGGRFVLPHLSSMLEVLHGSMFSLLHVIGLTGGRM